MTPAYLVSAPEPVAKNAAANGLDVQSINLVGSPWCCAIASQSQFEVRFGRVTIGTAVRLNVFKS